MKALLMFLSVTIFSLTVYIWKLYLPDLLFGDIPVIGGGIRILIMLTCLFVTGILMHIIYLLYIKRRKCNETH